ncbi:DNA-binding domain of Mlu1-box binding protein MBP1, partial [Hesseltinella vesiculosa]
MERLPVIHENCNFDTDCSRFKPFPCSSNMRLKVKRAKYSTSLDPRGYIPVYEYIINCQPIMWDRETGYVHFTGIWKALGNSKSDIVKMVDSNPELNVKKVRGGFLKIQGTWIPYDFAYVLCKRTAWNIRRELSVIFG